MREFGASSVPLGGTCNFMIRDSLAIVPGYFDPGRCPLVGCPVADSDMEAADKEKRRFKSGGQCYLLAAPRTASAELLTPRRCLVSQGDFTVNRKFGIVVVLLASGLGAGAARA